MKILCLVLVLGVLSCGKKGLEENRPQGEIRAALLPQPIANQYFASLDWTVTASPADSGDRVLVRNRSGQRTILCDLARCSKPFLDTGITAGEPLSYAILENEETLAETSLIAPKDFVLESVVRTDSLPRLSEFRRLFFRKGARLITGPDAVIAVEEIVADDAVIETFTETDVAATGPGRAAGRLIIKAKTASGKLQVISRGEKGAKGASGPVGVQGLTGKQGPAGEIWNCRNYAPGPHCERELNLSGTVPQGHPWFRNVYQCTTKSLDGHEGSDGGAGYPGLPGQAGGDSGFIHVEIDNPASLDLSIAQIGGQGGDGGDGGGGGIGGVGGAPGAQDMHGICPAGKQGPQGRQGPNGPTGPVGPPGNADYPKCVIAGAKREGACES